MLALVDQIRERTRMTHQAICSAVRLPYPSFMRWRKRLRKDMPLVRQPGPPKVRPPDFSRLGQDIKQLSHGQTRTQGTGALYARYATSISRRQLQAMVAMARHDLNAAHRQNLRRILWLVSNTVWSMDPCKYKGHMNQIQDLASRYKFEPMAGKEPCGEEIAGYLTAKFDKFGPPLLLKRDNGGNLNHVAVNEVLSEHFVLPLNSPIYYPPYNGAIEEAQSELKSGLAARLAYKPCPREHLEAYAATVAHDLNHKPRPCLNGKNSCQVYFSGKRTFTKWERRDAYDWITNLKNDMLCCDGVQPQAAWRIAVEAWLKMKGLITVTVNGKVLPNFL